MDRGIAALCFILTLAVSWSNSTSSVHAQSGGFAIDRYEPSERGSEWFALDSLDLRGHVRPAVGVIADYAYKPLVLRDASGHELGALVKHQLFLHLGASLVLWERLRVAINLPLSPAVRGDDSAPGATQFRINEGVALGDLRLSADARLFGRYRGPISGAFGVSLWLPTGTRTAFSGDGKVRFAPHFALAGDLAMFAYSAKVGFNYRAQDGSFSGARIGSELTFGAAAGLRALDGKLLVGPELYGSTVAQGGLFRSRATPIEGILGAHYLFASAWRLGAGVGTGFTEGFGSPALRVVASAEWVPQPPKPDSDRDGDKVVDKLDACPDEPGVSDADPKKNGCPLRDRDGDGVLDADDACPDQAGIADPDPSKNGCPAADRDGDNILDKLDACPEAAGPDNADPEKNGCPPARIERGQIRILEQVQFKTGSAIILPVSFGILDAVLQILKDHPEISKVSVEGHTDNIGSAKYNKQLSNQRVLSVLGWLTEHGIEFARLSSAGFGLERPLSSNATEEGRKQNRRVEFHIREIDGKPVGDDWKPAVRDPAAPAPASAPAALPVEPPAAAPAAPAAKKPLRRTPPPVAAPTPAAPPAVAPAVAPAPAPAEPPPDSLMLAPSEPSAQPGVSP